jgi:hypothetical protein
MFYILVSRVPFIYNVPDKKDKMFRIFLIGSICYIILHGLLYSRKFLENSFIQKYKSYLLYLAGIDFVLTSGIVVVLDKKPTENSYIENDEDAEDENENESNEKMTREQILQNYYNAQLLQQQAYQKANSPFITKTDAEELKKENVEKAHVVQELEPVKEVSKDGSIESSKSSKSSKKSTEKKDMTDKLIELIADTDLPIYEPENKL